MLHDYAAHYRLDYENTSGQGHCEAHAANPFHELFTSHGWKYSHTTRITRRDGTRYGMHCYKFPGSDWSLGVVADLSWTVTASRGGSGHVTYLFKRSRVESYVVRKSRELRRSAVSIG